MVMEVIRICFLLCCCAIAPGTNYLLGTADEYAAIVTTGDQSSKLSNVWSPATLQSESLGYSVWVDRRKRRQTIRGFGAAFTNAAASVIYKSPQRHDIMRDLFGSGADQLGLSYVRMTMGGSDFQAVNPYTYDDVDNDFDLNHFSIDNDRAFFIPILKEALSINPSLKIMATPWSAPSWLKTTHQLFGGEMKSDYQSLRTYANYFVKFIKAYEAEGIPIDAMTLQNEPMFSTNEYPSMKMSADTQKVFIRDHVGPLFRSNNIGTKILAYDHNWDGSSYPDSVLSDGGASQYVYGVAWHGYSGRHDTPGSFHNSHPDKAMFFTEISGGDWDSNFASGLTWNTRIIFIGQTRNWAEVVLLWNIALDEHNGPKVGVGGCNNCRGVLTVPSNGGPYTRNVEYYALGHMSKFVKPGAVRLESNDPGWDQLQTAAFANTDGSTVVVVQNPSSSSPATFSLDVDAKHYHFHNLPPQSVATFIK